MIWNSIFVAVGGFFGAVSRYGMSTWINKRLGSVFPSGTFTVNMIGSFLLGLIIGLDWPEAWQLLIGTGFMGAFTTFSTFKLENVQLFFKKEWKMSIAYMAITYVGGILLAFFGIWIGMNG